MKGPWRHTVASSVASPDAAVRGMDWEDAQRWCNFVLLRPGSLPADLVEARLEMRPEAPPGRPTADNPASRPDWTLSNRATHRAGYAGDRRRLRIKQFFYDYAPPAFDHPCLWKSDGIRAFVAGNHVGWLGTDFHRRRAATITVDRTTVELSVTDGTFDDEDLRSICRGLRPVAPEMRERILALPKAALCYQSRHREDAIEVPVGYWAHKRRGKNAVVAAGHVEAPWAAMIARETSILGEYGYCADSAFIFGDPDAPCEVDHYFQNRDDPGRYAHLLVSPKNVPGGVPYPPERESRQRCETRTVSVGGREVHHAYADARYGQHEAVWQVREHTFMLIVKPTPGTDMSWITRLLERLVTPPRSSGGHPDT